MRPNARIKLKIGETPTGKGKWVDTYRATADHYGWTEQFPVWTPKQHVLPGGGIVCYVNTGSSKLSRPGGRRHRICESPSKRGHPAGLTHRFRLSNNTTLLDIGELAHFTKQDWHWITAPNGARWSRCQWEAVYRAKHITTF